MAQGRWASGRRFVGEFLVIVIGVLVALWVEGWREDRSDRDLEQLYLARVLSDIQRDGAGFEYMVRHIGRTNRAAELLHSLVIYPSASPDDPVTFLVALEEARSIQNNPWATGTYDELLATGSVRVLRNADLRAAMAEYYLRLEELYTWVERRVDRSFRDGATAILPSDFRQAVFDRHWENPGAQPDSWVDGAAAPIDVARALQRLRSIPDVEVALSRIIDFTHGHRVFVDNARSLNATIETLVRAEIGA